MDAKGSVSLTPEFINQMPQIMGNSDFVRITQFLPGITQNNEYDAGLHVQGGEAHHNAFLIDGVRIYNPNHFLGLFSIFNSGHFENVSFRKNTSSSSSSSNCIGAELESSSKIHYLNRLGGELSVGPMSSQGSFHCQGTRSSATFSARQAYLNLLYSPLLRVDDMQIKYSFGDYNATFNTALSDVSQLSLGGYLGNDKVSLSNDEDNSNTKLNWGNYMAYAKYQYNGASAKMSFLTYLTHYDNSLHVHSSLSDVSLPSGIDEYGFKCNTSINYLSISSSLSSFSVQPQKTEVRNTASGNVSGSDSPKEHRLLCILNFAYQWLAMNNANISASAQLSGMHDIDSDTNIGNVDFTLTVQHPIANQGILSFNASTQTQYLSQVGFSSIGLPTDFWLSSSVSRKPEHANSISLSYTHRIANGVWRVTGETYYRDLHNQIEYTQDYLSVTKGYSNLESSIISGNGTNYGTSIMIQRLKGKLTGWTSYCYSRSWRNFNSQKYPSRHDRPHEINLVASYSVNSRVDIGTTFVYASGTPFTAPKSYMVIGGQFIAEYGEYNSARLDPYMRLDVSSNIWLKRSDSFSSGINISVYNATARRNPIFYRLKYNDKENYVKYRPLCFVANIMPSISFFIRF